MNFDDLRRVPAGGESETVEFKRSTSRMPQDRYEALLLERAHARRRWENQTAVGVALEDLDRVEIRSTGGLPAGITAEELSGPHPSVLRNPLIAETFHRTGAVEVWGRGTNRVIEECRRYGVDAPSFEEQGGAVVVTFKAPVALGPEGTPQVTPQVLAVLKAARDARNRIELMEAAGLRDREHFRSAYLEALLEAGWLEMTIPDKPRSSKQRYRTTEAGKEALGEAGEEG